MIISFGFQHGAPQRVDHTVDLRAMSHDLDSDQFKQQFRDIVELGRKNPQARIAIGCEHGKHRSVAMANKVATALRVSVYHRDRGR
jgi:RNase adaptor protein for sRNA GlmZ degradation